MQRDTAETQRAVLALCLQRPEAFRRVSALTTPEHFESENRELFSAFQRVGEPLDPSLVAGELGDKHARARVSALKFLEVDPANLEVLIGQLESAYRYRQLIGSLQRSLAEVQRSEAEYSVIAAKVEQDILTTTRATGSGFYISAEEALAEAYIEAQRAADAGGFLGIRTGIREVDGLIKGFGFGHVTTLMGEPGIGKTALMLQSAAHIARDNPVAIVSLEMTPADLAQRMQACLSGVQYATIQSGTLSDNEQTKVGVANETISHLKLHIAPSHVQTFAEAQAFFRWTYFEHGCRILYLDNILSLDYEGQTEYEHVTRVANGSQRLAKELQIGLVNLHHTNTSDRPDLRSTHGAKAIARHSSNVLALYAEQGIYNTVELLELKGRNVGKGQREMIFEGAFQRFRSKGVSDFEQTNHYR